MQTAYTVLILLMLVGVSRLLGRVIPLPLPLVQIAAGAVLAWPTLGLHVALEPELFLFLFLPPLLFSDGWRMPKREFWRLRGPILTLAVGLVLFTVVGAGYFIHWLLPRFPCRWHLLWPRCCHPPTRWPSRPLPKTVCRRP